MKQKLHAEIRRAGKLKDQFRCILKGANGEKVFTSETYTRKQKALSAARLVDPDIKIVDLTKPTKKPAR